MPPRVQPQRLLRGHQKAAALLIALGPERSSAVLRHFREREIESLTMEIFQMERVDEDMKDSVLEECYNMALARDYITSGGMDYARDVLMRALGQGKAQEIIERIATLRRPQRFSFARDAEPAQLAQFIANEHPQTVALILAHLPPYQAAATLSHFPEELHADIALRIATMDRTPPEVVDELEEVLNKKFSTVVTRDYSAVGGTSFLVSVLAQVDRATERTILEGMEARNSDLTGEVRKMMFLFDDVGRLDDRSVQRLLREVDNKGLALALRGGSSELQDKIFKNLSTRAAQALREEIEIGGRVRLRQVEEAQQRIVDTVRRLEAAEELVIQRGTEDLFV
jgi:flagellar motor switch protein FliG